MSTNEFEKLKPSKARYDQMLASLPSRHAGYAETCVDNVREQIAYTLREIEALDATEEQKMAIVMALREGLRSDVIQPLIINQG